MTLTWLLSAIAAGGLFLSAVVEQSGLSRESPHKAWVVGEWVLARADRGPIGIVSRAAACTGRLYLLVRSKNTIYEVRLKQPVLGIGLGPDELGPLAKNEGELVDLFADCQANLLSAVIDPFKPDAPSVVATFDLRTRQLVRTFELPLEFSLSSAGAAHYDAATRHVYLAGIWPLTRNGWMTKPEPLALTDATFGLNLSLDNGRVSKFLAGTEKGCRAWIASCLDSFFARVGPDQWVFAHGLGTQLSVIGSGQAIRRLDMRSPMFRYLPNDSVPRNGPRDQGLAWGFRNSEIRGLFVVDGYIIAMHAHHSTENPGRGGWVDFAAYLNVFSQQGERTYSDLRVSGLAIAASSDAVWVISYRPERNSEATEIVMQRVSPRPAPVQ